LLRLGCHSRFGYQSACRRPTVRERVFFYHPHLSGAGVRRWHFLIVSEFGGHRPEHFAFGIIGFAESSFLGTVHSDVYGGFARSQPFSPSPLQVDGLLSRFLASKFS